MTNRRDKRESKLCTDKQGENRSSPVRRSNNFELDARTNLIVRTRFRTRPSCIGRWVWVWWWWLVVVSVGGGEWWLLRVSVNVSVRRVVSNVHIIYLFCPIGVCVMCQCRVVCRLPICGIGFINNCDVGPRITLCIRPGSCRRSRRCGRARRSRTSCSVRRRDWTARSTRTT